ncbi:MAG: methyltransferase, partial [Vallitaleaceae bacterium]|nr:methyltransferase [Vallitaleaceae bacterium]
KKWQMPDGTPVLVGNQFNTTVDEKGNTFIYPQGDLSVKPSGKLPKGGYYFDGLVRQEPIDEDHMNGKLDYQDDFEVMNDATLRSIEEQVNYYYNNTDYGINLGNFVAGLGDFAPLPGPGLKKTKGIRNVEEWMMAHYLHPEYVKEIFDYQTEIALENLKLLKQAVGNKAQVIQISGTDFGTQQCEIMSPDTYREFYKPYYKKINQWVHDNTQWKTFYHCCGSIVRLLDDFAEIGIDVLNPVQCSAVGMDPKFLKEKYGEKFVFWGGGVDTQKTLPFGTPEEVKKEVLERLAIFTKGGGFVFNAIHNIQGPTPIENILAMFEAVQEFNNKPIKRW